MRTTRKLHRLSFDVPKFLADYNDAVASEMHVSEFCGVTGMFNASLHHRLRILARRGVVLPLLKGMKKRTKTGRILGVCDEPPRPERAPKARAETPHAPVVVPTFQICVGSGI